MAPNRRGLKLSGIVIEKELGLSPAEFSKHLPYALRGYQCIEVTEGIVRAERDEWSRVTISVQELPPRKLTSILSIPRSLVTFVFEGFERSRVTSFLENFDRAFQRGGG